jgi:hypothetical protein
MQQSAATISPISVALGDMAGASVEMRAVLCLCAQGCNDEQHLNAKLLHNTSWLPARTKVNRPNAVVIENFHDLIDLGSECRLPGPVAPSKYATSLLLCFVCGLFSILLTPCIDP